MLIKKDDVIKGGRQQTSCLLRRASIWNGEITEDLQLLGVQKLYGGEK